MGKSIGSSYTVECQHCCQGFNSVRSDAKWCSSRCKQRAYRKRNQERNNRNQINIFLTTSRNLTREQREERAIKRYDARRQRGS